MHDKNDGDVDPEVEDIIEEAKHPRRHYKPNWNEKQERRNNVKRMLLKGDRRSFLESLRRAGIKDGTEEFLRASEAFDRYHKR